MITALMIIGLLFLVGLIFGMLALFGTTTKVIGQMRFNGVWYDCYVAATDGTAINLTIKDLASNLKTISDVFNGGAVFEAAILQCGIPSNFDLFQIKDKNGGIVYEGMGAIAVALGANPQFVCEGVQIPVGPGYTIQVKTSD